jgi:hypothetical protein
MLPNCLTCKYLSHDAEGLKVCGKVYGWIACYHCKEIQPITDYRYSDGGRMACGKCGLVMGPTVKDDWREGYIGNGSGGQITPLPCCPGWEAAQVDARPVDRQKSLFEMED